MQDRRTVKASAVRPGLFLQPYVVSQLVGTLIQRVVEGSAVSSTEFALASWLNETGSATPTEAAEALGLSATTVSAMIERLVQKGEVRRVRHPADGRSYLLETTEQGKATHARNTERLRAEVRAVRANLAGDADEILAALRLLEDALRKTLDASPSA